MKMNATRMATPIVTRPASVLDHFVVPGFGSVSVINWSTFLAHPGIVRRPPDRRDLSRTPDEARIHRWSHDGYQHLSRSGEFEGNRVAPLPSEVSGGWSAIVGFSPAFALVGETEPCGEFPCHRIVVVHDLAIVYALHGFFDRQAPIRRLFTCAGKVTDSHQPVVEQRTDRA
jgi:hypothetical protein